MPEDLARAIIAAQASARLLLEARLALLHLELPLQAHQALLQQALLHQALLQQALLHQALLHQALPHPHRVERSGRGPCRQAFEACTKPRRRRPPGRPRQR